MVELEFMCLADAFLMRWFHKAKLKKIFVWHYPGFHLVGRSIGLFFFLIYLRPKVTLHCVYIYIFRVSMRDVRKLFNSC